MTALNCRLETRWVSTGENSGKMEFELYNLGEATLFGFRLAYTSLTRIDDAHQCQNATLVNRCANLHEVAPPEGFELLPGQVWKFAAAGLSRPARHRTDGVSSAYLALSDGTFHDISIGAFLPASQPATIAPQLVPPGELNTPLALLPWPNSVTIVDFVGAPVALCPAHGTSPEEMAAISEVARLYQRLFPGDAQPFSLGKVSGGLLVEFERDELLEPEGYGLRFCERGIRIGYRADAGRFYALISLAQIMKGARDHPEKFSFPAGGSIYDSPRYQWRGCHLDVSRQVYSIESVARFIDILAWNKLNVLHWHLNDDEGWRLEIKAFPELTEIGSKRGPTEKIAAQLGGGAITTEGHYAQEQVRTLIADAQRLQVDIMPEIDIPGHCTAVLAALPDLIDGQEAPDSYYSVQGYANNSLNPGLPQTFEFLQKMFVEVAELFPFSYIHVGGDEVAEGAWLASPKAKSLMNEHNLEGTAQLQAYMLGKVKTMLTGMGKKLSGWDEVSHGGGVDPKDTMLMAWQNAELGPKLAEMGYDVVMTPGEAYYLDMVQSQDWQEPGLNWAARQVPPKLTYEFEAAGDFPAELAHKLKGIQGCIWSENLVSRELFNHMVFPRLCAIAEAAWTPREQKNWQRFAAICRLMPQL